MYILYTQEKLYTRLKQKTETKSPELIHCKLLNIKPNDIDLLNMHCLKKDTTLFLHFLFIYIP